MRTLSVKKCARSEWVFGIRQTVSDLEALNRSTEDGFLSIGQNIGEFMSVAREISGDVTALVKMMSDDQGEDASQALIRARGESMELLTRAEATSGTLGQLRQSAGRIRRNLAGFESVITSFRSVGALTRIETARLDTSQADFGHLAEAVKSLTDNIQSKVERTLEAATILEAKVQSALTSIAELDGRQEHELPTLISGVGKDIETFHQARQRAQQSSLRLASRYDALSKTCGNLTVLLQFHDITRQQVEHVIEGLSELLTEDGSFRTSAGSVSSVVSLQASQLANTRRTFESAASQVDRSLGEIAAEIQEMAAESSALMGSSVDEQNSFFLEMERRLEAILQQLKVCQVVDKDAQQALSGLRQSLEGMRASIHDIQAIELQIERLAINATIRATHIGRPGDALNVIATAMQAHATDCSTLSGQTIATLDTMDTAIVNIIGVPGDRQAGEVANDLAPAIQALHESSERSYSGMSEIAGLARRLSNDIQEVRDGFTVGAVFGETAERCLQRLTETAAAIAAETGADIRQTVQLEDFSARYTMQVERDVHMAASASAEGREAELVSAAVSVPEDPDANVEFF